jgi:hypothetical protein
MEAEVGRQPCLVLLQFFLSLLPPLLSHFADFWSWSPGRPNFFSAWTPRRRLKNHDTVSLSET